MSKRRREKYDPYRPPRGGAPAAAQTTRRRALVWLGVGGAALGGMAAVPLLGRLGQSSVTTAAPADLDLDTVTVDRPAIDLGRVKLDVQVPVSVTLTNQSRRQVILRQATVETLEGC